MIVTSVGGLLIVVSFVVRYLIAIILMRNRELVALLGLFSRRLVMVVWLFLALPYVCLKFVSVVFPDTTILDASFNNTLKFGCMKKFVYSCFNLE